MGTINVSNFWYLPLKYGYEEISLKKISNNNETILKNIR